MGLTTSEKINLIREITNRLADESWPIIDLTLKSFELPISDTWQGDKLAYLLQMISQASDTVLAALGNHVGLTLGNSQHHGVEPAFWKKSRLKMFISHLATHKIQASEIQIALNNRGISSFVAHSDIEPTQEWQTQIEVALSTCDVLIALLQPDFHASLWTDQEIGFAMGRALPVFTVRLGQDPYGFMGRFQAFNGHGKANKDRKCVV